MQVHPKKAYIREIKMYIYIYIYVKGDCWLCIYMYMRTGPTGDACLNGACCLYMCKHTTYACINRACCMYMCEFIYM